jgi:hypothetical protein
LRTYPLDGLAHVSFIYKQTDQLYLITIYLFNHSKQHAVSVDARPLAPLNLGGHKPLLNLPRNFSMATEFRRLVGLPEPSKSAEVVPMVAHSEASRVPLSSMVQSLALSDEKLTPFEYYVTIENGVRKTKRTPTEQYVWETFGRIDAMIEHHIKSEFPEKYVRTLRDAMAEFSLTDRPEMATSREVMFRTSKIYHTYYFYYMMNSELSDLKKVDLWSRKRFYDWARYKHLTADEIVTWWDKNVPNWLYCAEIERIAKHFSISATLTNPRHKRLQRLKKSIQCAKAGQQPVSNQSHSSSLPSSSQAELPLPMSSAVTHSKSVDTHACTDVSTQASNSSQAAVAMGVNFNNGVSYVVPQPVTFDSAIVEAVDSSVHENSADVQRDNGGSTEPQSHEGAKDSRGSLKRIRSENLVDVQYKSSMQSVDVFDPDCDALVDQSPSKRRKLSTLPNHPSNPSKSSSTTSEAELPSSMATAEAPLTTLVSEIVDADANAAIVAMVDTSKSSVHPASEVVQVQVGTLTEHSAATLIQVEEPQSTSCSSSPLLHQTVSMMYPFSPLENVTLTSGKALVQRPLLLASALLASTPVSLRTQQPIPLAAPLALTSTSDQVDAMPSMLVAGSDVVNEGVVDAMDVDNAVDAGVRVESQIPDLAVQMDSTEEVPDPEQTAGGKRGRKPRVKKNWKELVPPRAKSARIAGKVKDGEVETGGRNRSLGVKKTTSTKKK